MRDARRETAAWIAYALAGATGVFAVVSWLVDWESTGWIDAVTTLIPVPVAFAAGWAGRRWSGGLVVAGLAAAVEVTTGFNPFVLVITLGPWFVGVIVQDRQQLVRRLEAVGREIEAETVRLGDEAVRLERARIARELHDIVAHCVSVMVVQAYAGDRLVGADRASAAEAFDHIEAAAAQAGLEIAHLVDLLADDRPAPASSSLATALDELVSGTAAAGLNVTLHLVGAADDVAPPEAAVIYRVIQEGITNALKHAPGAPIVVSVDCGDTVIVDVINGPSPTPDSVLASVGGGHGLSGLRARVSDLGGSVDAGPRAAGAWRLSVRLPIA